MSPSFGIWKQRSQFQDDQPATPKKSFLKGRWFVVLALAFVVTVASDAKNYVWPNGNGDLLFHSKTSALVEDRPNYVWNLLRDKIAPTDRDKQKFSDPTSPQSQAWNWLTEQDDYSSEPERMSTTELLERYVLAVLYYSTSGESWTQCKEFLSPVSVCLWDDCSEDWDVTEVACSDDDIGGRRVNFLDLERHGLVGTIPWEIGLLENLRVMSMGFNALNGTIPSQVERLTHLTRISLGQNSLSGSLPVPLMSSSGLETLTLSSNRFSGTLPPEWGTFPSLRWVSVDSNDISGTIPSSFGKLTNIRYMNFDNNNKMTGTVPEALIQRLPCDGLPGTRACDGRFPRDPNA